MAQQRLRKFHPSAYCGSKIANEMCMVVRAGNIIFLRGQTGFDLDNKFVGKGDAAAQADQAMKNVKVLLEEARAKMAHICKVTTYITDRAYREPVYNVLRRHLKGVFPCGPGLILPRLPLPELLAQPHIPPHLPPT